MKHLNEYYDSDEKDLDRISKSELKKLARLDFKDKFRFNLYTNKTNGDLQDNVARDKYVNDRINMHDVMADLVKEAFPAIKFIINVPPRSDSETQIITSTHEKPLGFIQYQRFKTQIQLSLSYHIKERDYLDIEKGTFDMFLSTTIRREKGSYNPNDPEDIESVRLLTLMQSESDGALGYDIIQKILYGSPSEEDTTFANENQLNEKSIDTVISLRKNLQLAKHNIDLFRRYCATAYDVDPC